MKAENKTQITINVGGERLVLTVDFDDQIKVRDTERAIQNLFLQWQKRFPGKTNSQLLAMIAYQYASFYGELQSQTQKGIDELQDCISEAKEIKIET